jgi:biopolymer transport protein ExbB
MLQETTAAAPAAAGGNNAAALQQMGFDHLITQLDAVGWIVFVTLMVMSLMSWYWIIINFVKNIRLRGRGDKVIDTFWQTTNPQEAIRAMEAQPANEPFSKIALECANAAAHHAKNEGSRLVEALNRSEFIDRALRRRSAAKAPSSRTA